MRQIAADREALTVAMELLLNSYLASKVGADKLRCPQGAKTKLTASLVRNILDSAKTGLLLNTCNPGLLFWRLRDLAPKTCPKVYASLKAIDPSLDGFALSILNQSFDSIKGQRLELPEDRSRIDIYCPMQDLQEHAKMRLADRTLSLPALAAWRAIAEEKSVYVVDGTYVRN